MPAASLVPATVLHHRDALYDIVLLAHVLAVLLSLVALVAAGASALVLAGSGVPSPATRRYYDGRTHWLGRVLFAVPVLGAVLIGLSGGDWTWGSTWVLIGLALWAVAALAAEMELWPAEQRIAEHLAAGRPPADVVALCRRTAALAGVVTVLVVVAAVVMVAKP